jgi:hypothetical protein
VDGFVRAMWVPDKTGLVITPFEKAIPKGERPAIVEEALRLLDFLAAGEKRDVRFAPAKT